MPCQLLQDANRNALVFGCLIKGLITRYQLSSYLSFSFLKTQLKTTKERRIPKSALITNKTAQESVDKPDFPGRFSYLNPDCPLDCKLLAPV